MVEQPSMALLKSAAEYLRDSGQPTDAYEIALAMSWIGKQESELTALRQQLENSKNLRIKLCQLLGLNFELANDIHIYAEVSQSLEELATSQKDAARYEFARDEINLQEWQELGKADGAKFDALVDELIDAEKQRTECACEACKSRFKEMRVILCSICGDKRCPHAADHRNACAG